MRSIKLMNILVVVPSTSLHADFKLSNLAASNPHKASICAYAVDYRGNFNKKLSLNRGQVTVAAEVNPMQYTLRMQILNHPLNNRIR